ncbi:Cytochrome c oxidase caa3 assembly factor [Stieleria neptunia]|uniref:Cytochrome c oxidase caa3 assembly factor n=1 Tax=Stieleria neptunia TaxID=2527979 RepID=A0A518HNG8_9BACT|nr:cytochrome c oxidase assembly protein [Stieleria neptunia]QDV42383.1 Cytochrome c oxidase caa3 assembly factor [Stieleria neptunia]
MRLLIWNLGWVILTAAWMGPLPDMARHSFAAHMTLHMLVVAIVAPMLSLAAAGRRFDPVRVWPAFFAPVPASVGELIIVWAWHGPGLHHWARHDTLGFVVEQSMFLAAGTWVWLSAFGGTQPRTHQRSAAGVVGLLLTSMHMTLLGALLALSPRLLFHHPHGMSGLTPLEDQHLGGAVMLVVGGIVYLAGGLVLTADLLRNRSAALTSRQNESTTRPSTVEASA